MSRAREDRLVNCLEAVGAPLPRENLWDRFSDDYETEGDLAKTLGQLVASGRLLRDRRQRPGRPDEFVYAAPKTAAPTRSETPEPAPPTPPARTAAIAAAARKVPPRQSHRPTPPTATPTPKETPMANEPATNRQKYIDYLKPALGWVAPKAIAIALKEKREIASYHLRAIAAEGQIQASGKMRGLRYAALGVAGTSSIREKVPKTASTPAPAAHEAPAASTTAKKKTKERAPAIPPARRARNLAEFGAESDPNNRRLLAQIPVFAGEVPVCNEPRCAIENDGRFAINDGVSTIRLSPGAVGSVVHFLELTQHVWKKA